ncbi:hypothetical protein MJO28_012025 [Puccinia striiformis f. sp. tritici]|uniref:Uncharacterized protein n=1 Tax=Puccinia striiformis f. sp. tritici TaxID=168172 RepID=A0ACC0E0P1_9BASI|nr:hypothetical protein MJO28_012025 [Puccinia striiformis f. sp. tritici]
MTIQGAFASSNFPNDPGFHTEAESHRLEPDHREESGGIRYAPACVEVTVHPTLQCDMYAL